MDRPPSPSQFIWIRSSPIRSEPDNNHYAMPFLNQPLKFDHPSDQSDEEQHPDESTPQTISSSKTKNTTTPPSPSVTSGWFFHPALHHIHAICLTASKRYLHVHRLNHILRTVGPSRTQHTHKSRFAPYSSKSTTNTPPPRPTDSLLANTSAICSLLWARAGHSRGLVMGAERGAAREMGLLLEAAETVLFGDEGEAELVEEEAVWRVVDAGVGFCRWLGDEEACERIGEVLEGMEWEEEVGEIVEEEGGEDGNGDDNGEGGAFDRWSGWDDGEWEV